MSVEIKPKSSVEITCPFCEERFSLFVMHRKIPKPIKLEEQVETTNEELRLAAPEIAERIRDLICTLPLEESICKILKAHQRILNYNQSEEHVNFPMTISLKVLDILQIIGRTRRQK